MATPQVSEESYGRGLARAAAGALIFSLPLMMTMEMWELGLHIDRLRLAIFCGVGLCVVFGLSRFAGFRDATGLVDDLLDTFAAVLVGLAVIVALLAVMGLIGSQTPLDGAIGMVAVQLVPASMGAMLANKQLRGGRKDQQAEDRAGYLGQLFLMGAGALFFAFNVAPTEEMILIGFKMTPWQALAMIALSLVTLHLLVFSVGFAGQEKHESHARAFLHFTLAGYGLALIVSLYCLWTFGRLDGGLGEALRSVVVLGFPAAIGAAVARLVV